MPLSQKVALITGAGRGTGQRLALELAQAGATIIVVDINPDAVQRTVDAITQAGGHAVAQPNDVSHKIATQTMLYAVLEQFPRIDILLNAAHIAPSNSALKMDEGEWNRTLDVNLKGAFIVSQTVARAMKETGGGLIINLLRPPSAHAAVNAARSGLLGLTEALAAEWTPHGITVKAVESADALLVIRELTNNQ
ncbi:MAG: SDR family NAD(P)-dependent oxidoreductase [Anaerolineales bacterium]|nr:SDR family NAD(P)-dependent oxidoreductase [Anaerolineales bacterium]